MTIRKTLLSNLISLSGMQFANYLLPLITIPYITRIIGPEYFGLINYAQAIVGYFLLAVNYSFDLSATREIAINRENNQKLSNIFFSVIYSRVLIFIISSIVFILLLFNFSKLLSETNLYIFSYLYIIGNIFFPTWFLQGIEKLTKLAIFNFLIKIIFTVSIFLFISEPEDYLIIPLITSLSQIVFGVIAFFYVIKKFNLKLSYPNSTDIKQRFNEGKTIFLSSVAINLYTTSNIVILGFFASNLYLGYFSASQKIINVFIGLIMLPINLSFFPKIGNAIDKSREHGINILKKLTLIVSILTLLSSILVFIFAKLIIVILLGDKFVDAVTTLKIISFLPFIIGLSNIFGIQGLLNLKKDKEFFLITIMGAFLSIVLNLILAPIYFDKGSALSWILTESFITTACYLILYHNKIKLFDFNYFKKILKNKSLV